MDKHSHIEHEIHHHSVASEIACHLPYAVFSVALSLVILSILNFIGVDKDADDLRCIWDQLFHNFHFMHIVFASVGTMLTFFRFSRNLLRGLVVSFCSSMIFCVLSDIVLPYIGGTLLGVNMHLHICFYYELKNILPFLLVGLFTGFVMKNHALESRDKSSLWSHFTHIFISSLASSFYLVSHGFYDWPSKIGYVFLVLIACVLVPCTLSDVVIPVIFAKSSDKKNEKH